MFYRVSLLLAVIFITWSAAIGQQPATPVSEKFKLSEIQHLKLQVLQKDALLAKAAMESAQQAFQQSVLNLTNEAEKIKLENHWDAKTQFDPNTVTFSAPPEPKKDEKK